MDLSVGNYANADFTDSDAGAGGTNIESLQGYVDIKTAINNLIDSTCNIVEGTMSDYRKKLDAQRSGLKLLCSAESLVFFDKFLKPEEEQEPIMTAIELSKTLTNPNFNPSSRDFFKNLNIDLSGNNIDINEELGCDYDELSETIAKINELYHTCVSDLFMCDTTLQNNIKNVERLLKQVNTVLILEENDSSSELYASLSKYIHETFTKINLADSFNNFIKARRKFIQYKNLLGLKYAAEVPEGVPACNICMDAPISMVLVGCGHTFCNTCGSKQLVNCYICRCRIQQRLRLYFN
jgi:hypothetical protein